MKTIEARNVTANGERYRIVRATYGLQRFEGQAPYFSVSGEGWYADSRRRDPDVVGQMHDVIAEAFPQLTDLLALHLSDVNGVPMHAEANGWYWYQEKGPEEAERYLRAPVGHFPPGITDRTEFATLVDALRSQWQAEAEGAISAHNLA